MFWNENIFSIFAIYTAGYDHVFRFDFDEETSAFSVIIVSCSVEHATVLNYTYVTLKYTTIQS